MCARTLTKLPPELSQCGMYRTLACVCVFVTGFASRGSICRGWLMQQQWWNCYDFQEVESVPLPERAD